jgi:hypothetical protein
VSGLFARLESYGDRFRLEREVAVTDEWIACDRLLDPTSAELERVLEAERVASGQVSEHATALTVMAVYAGTVTVSALLAWALGEGVVDVRPGNTAIRLSEHHGFEAVALREPRVVDGAVDTLVGWVLDEHLLPLADALHERTRAGRRQLLGGVAQGCSAAFTIGSRHGDVTAFERAWEDFVSAAGHGVSELGDVVRLREGGREGLFYLRNTCCLYYTSAEAELCASCCVIPREERIASYRTFLRETAAGPRAEPSGRIGQGSRSTPDVGG